MTLKVALVSESLFADDPRSSFLEQTLTSRGDEVRTWRVPYNGSALAQWGTLGAAFQGVFALKRQGALDVLCVSGGSRTMGLLGALARPAGLEVVIDLALQGRPGHPADVAIAVGASRLVARDLATYEALLRAGVPAYQAGIALDPPTAGPIETRAKEPQVKGKVPVRITACDAKALEKALAEIEIAKTKEPRLVVDLRGPDGQPRDAEVPLADALVAWVIATTFDKAAIQACGEAMGTGVALMLSTPDRTAARDGADLVEADAERMLILGKNKDERARVVERGRAWDEAYGFKAQSRLWLRAVDAACADKVAAMKKAKQASVEGVKTGTRKT